MAKELMEIKELDEVWFSPANISPFKLEAPPASTADRLAMVSLAIENEPKFRLYSEEAFRTGPSYTIDTVEHLLKDEEIKFYLIISDESVPGVFQWKNAKELVSLIPLLVGSRIGSSPPEDGNPAIRQALKEGWTPTKPFPVSSTEIRQRLKDGKDCSTLVPRNVLDFIYQNHLYYAS
jgi:nicotinate-nucleotide adenylyltransferase